MPTNVPVAQNVCKPASSTQSAFINNKEIKSDKGSYANLPVDKNHWQVFA
jgi:hypothetical protein